MKISRIEIKNFKSFEDISVDLNDFNVIVGKHSTGKSNFLEIFRFLKDICKDLQSGVYRHGESFFKNINLDSDSPSQIKVKIDNGNSLSSELRAINHIKYNSIEYELVFYDFNTVYEQVKFNFEDNCDGCSQNSLVLTNKDLKISAEFLNDKTSLEMEDFIPESLLIILNNNLKYDNQLIINSPLSMLPFSWADYFKSIKFYNFDSKFCRVDNGGFYAELSSYGQNLAGVLERILQDRDKQRTFYNLVSILLPFVEKIDIVRLIDGTRLISLSETYNDSPVTSSFISDGTLNILALIVVLYFEDGNIILIEDVEKNIHPELFIQLVGMMEEVSAKKQIIITTHSPEILNNCSLEDIYLISRNHDGYSTVTKPADNEYIKGFIEELGVGQVFSDGYLEIESQ